MTSTQERLDALEKADFDSFGEQDEGPGEFKLATPEEVDAIQEAFYDRPWEDPTRFQDGFRILFVAVASIASGYASVRPDGEQHHATQALRRLMARTLHGEEQAEVNRHG